MTANGKALCEGGEFEKRQLYFSTSVDLCFRDEN
jgi:hypothetical protein